MGAFVAPAATLVGEVTRDPIRRGPGHQHRYLPAHRGKGQGQQNGQRQLFVVDEGKVET